MAKKKPLFGVNTYKGATRIKRPGRHAKNRTKNFHEKSIADKVVELERTRNTT